MNNYQVGENWYVKFSHIIELKKCEIIHLGVEVITLHYFDNGSVTKTFMKSDISLVEKH